MQGDGVARCIQTAMKNAGVQPEEVPCRFRLLLASPGYLYHFVSLFKNPNESVPGGWLLELPWYIYTCWGYGGGGFECGFNTPAACIFMFKK